MEQHVERVIREYLDAVEAAHGREYRDRCEVRYTGGSHILVRHPDDEEGELLPIGHVEEMTAHLRRNGAMPKAA